MKFQIHPFHSFQDYFSADVMAVYQGKWIFCMHRERTTWEHPGGWIEPGETPLEAARRELYEETGAVEFELEPLCDYEIDGVLNGLHYRGNGQVYFAVVHRLDRLPAGSEMGKIGLFDALPEALTYPILCSGNISLLPSGGRPKNRFDPPQENSRRASHIREALLRGDDSGNKRRRQ